MTRLIRRVVDLAGAHKHAAPYSSQRASLRPRLGKGRVLARLGKGGCNGTAFLNILPLSHSRTFCILLHNILVGVIFGVLIVTAMPTYVQEAEGLRPLLAQDALQSILPEDARLLDDANLIEGFLERLEGTPPNWKEIYGDHGAGHDERLFALNRERDRLREGRDGLTRRLTFLWSGELSTYDSERGGFHVAIGPKLISTRWGVVRFKPESLPSNLVAVPPAGLNESLQKRVRKGERIEIDVAVTGRLISDESIIYDFAHDEPGQGMVMPVVRVEQMDYILKQ